jgi:photosystem II stability/assembly factor-like uncharacterized protein
MPFPTLARTLCLGALAAACLNGQKWQMQYFYDQAKSVLAISDMQFPSANRGIAVGVIQEGRSQKPVSLTTTDGGARWTQTPLEDEPVSLFFLNDSLGWMVTEKGIWQTTEGGRDWRKLSKPPSPCLRVWFSDENHGVAACSKKSVLETFDGGKKWTQIAEAAKPSGAPDRSVYTWIAFATPRYGLITGFNQPVTRWSAMFPTWLDPEEALSRREMPHLAYTLSTSDGGKTWSSGSASLLGHVTRIRFRTDGMGLGLIEYADSFKYPSEAYRLDWKTGKSETVFRDRKHAITDIWFAKDGTAYLAGIEVTGEVRSVMPGQVTVFRSKDLKGWEQMPVDYRANAQRAIFGGVDDLFLATDNGMILKLK